MKIRFQQQSEHSECGLACVTMLVDYFIKKTNISELRDKYGVPNGGYNLFQMQKILAENNLTSKAVKTEEKFLASIPTPFITFYDRKHFMIVEKVSKNTIYVVDPASGRRTVTFSDFKMHYSNAVLYVTKYGHRKRKILKINKNLKSSIFKIKRSLFITLGISFISQSLGLFVPFSIQSIIDNSSKEKVGFSISFLIGTALFIFTYFFVNMVKMRILTRLQTEIDETLLGKTIEHLLNLPFSYFVNRRKGELIYRINSNSYIRQLLIDQILELVLSSSFFIIYIVVLFSMNKLLTLITLSIVSILVTSSIINSKINQKILQKQMLVMTKSQEIVNEMITNIFTIKSLNSSQYIYKNWKNNFTKQIDMEREKANYSSIFMNIPNTIQSFYPLIVFFFGYLLAQYKEMTIGEVVAFSSIGVLFLTPVLSMANVYNQLLMVKVYIDKLLDILETPREIEGGEVTLERYQGKINLEELSYKYSHFSEYTLNNISLNILPHQKIAIVGASGSGKSTLLKIMASLYPVHKGQVCYDDIQKQKISLDKFREHIGVVLQENILFNGTIRENILMGRDFPEDEIEKSIQIANLEELCSSFPLGINTIISENGQNISGGQRQKISIARAIISQPKAIFMDEPTSGLDNISENIIMSNIFKLPSTVVVVAHRLSMISKFDKIFVMKHGEIVGSGQHHELLNSCSEYQKLYTNNNDSIR
ncbi:peptidase domain-containing ABC transporter [Lactococcus lactis]|uniref:peptidase domain-containing ABC transporter n=1 Tax=Lactococcus TaxID=1357 RepID=UPI0021A3C635|nr:MULTISPECIES: peptidase domain-containing ABC transporter [Lactococcus]MCT3116697.1 peptidase domain-containing ABC transporter [Lactococcus lactis]MDM7475108.1 peptidase domain-containing ABC transporter [Lactococcus lactis]MDM7522470.1 peptidase domain-containing ABC transporter [Lactococcus lactis]MDR9867996.1 peptidase domain-containing ABC transporter [Lactococcus cremoris]